MLVQYFKRATERLPFIYNGSRAYSAPTTFLRKGDDFEFSGEGNVFRILTPRGQEALVSLEESLGFWGHIAVQQLCADHDGVFTYVAGTFSWYEDYMLEMSLTPTDEKLVKAEECIRALSEKLEEYFNEKLRVSGFLYKGRVFISEVGPIFAYGMFSPSAIFKYYLSKVKSGNMSVEDVLKRMERYGCFFREVSFPKKLVQEVLNWLVQETGMGSFVGVIDGTNLKGETECQGITPNGKLYRITDLNDIPKYGPIADQVALVLASEVVSTPRLDVVWTELLKVIESWTCMKKITIYLEGISTQEEFLHLSKVLGTLLPIGICVVSWGQLLRLDYSPVQSSHGTLVDVDSLVDDGVFHHLHTKLEAESVVNPLLFSILEKRNIGPDISVMVTEKQSLQELIKLCRHIDCIYTDGGQFFTAIMCLATSKL